MNRLATLVVTAFLLSGALAIPARAEFMVPPIWTYTAVSSPNPITSGDATVVIQGKHGPGWREIVAANVFTYDSSRTPTVIDPTPFTETLYVRDATGNVGSVSFDFLLSGMVSRKAAHLAIVPNGPTSHEVHIGRFFYTFTVENFEAPDKTSAFGGTLEFKVDIRHNPEPSSLLLAALGVPLLGRLRRRSSLAVS